MWAFICVQWRHRGIMTLWIPKAMLAISHFIWWILVFEWTIVWGQSFGKVNTTVLAHHIQPMGTISRTLYHHYFHHCWRNRHNCKTIAANTTTHSTATIYNHHRECHQSPLFLILSYHSYHPHRCQVLSSWH